MKERNQKYKILHREVGICIECPLPTNINPRTSKHEALCPKHKEIHNENARKRYAKRMGTEVRGYKKSEDRKLAGQTSKLNDRS